MTGRVVAQTAEVDAARSARSRPQAGSSGRAPSLPVALIDWLARDKLGGLLSRPVALRGRRVREPRFPPGGSGSLVLRSRADFWRCLQPRRLLRLIVGGLSLRGLARFELISPAAQQAVESDGRTSARPATDCLAPVVDYHGRARCHRTARAFLMRPQLNSSTLGGRRDDHLHLNVCDALLPSS